MSNRAPTSCVVCGRTIEWREKWGRSWDDVRCCSTASRRCRIRPVEGVQRGWVVDPSTAKGPIRLRRAIAA